MVVKSVAINAYQSAMDVRRKALDNTVTQRLTKPEAPKTSFGDTMKQSMGQLSEMQSEKKAMIEEFASGKKQNVHELMITMQKASVAMSMTSAVRSKVMQSYQEIMRMPF